MTTQIQETLLKSQGVFMEVLGKYNPAYVSTLEGFTKTYQEIIEKLGKHDLHCFLMYQFGSNKLDTTNLSSIFSKEEINFRDLALELINSDVSISNPGPIEKFLIDTKVSYLDQDLDQFKTSVDRLITGMDNLSNYKGLDYVTYYLSFLNGTMDGLSEEYLDITTERVMEQLKGSRAIDISKAISYLPNLKQIKALAAY